MLLILATTLLVTTTWVLVGVKGHGRLMDPPARNSMWRLGFANPVNYNDNELYCGGRMTQWARNSGKCGVCGDPHHAKREHEAGGKYANGIITREYKQGDVIDVTVHVTANHKGFFEFRICPVEDPKVEVTQECLDKHVLEKADGNGTKYFLPESQSNQFFNVTVRLPNDLTCNQCVIQWKYRTGNTWDKDETGNFCVGCGPQEEFYNCADVSIRSKGTVSQKSPTSNNGNTGKLNAEPKKSAILFSNDDSEAGYHNSVSKSGDFGSQKGKFTQETSKYSILTSDGNSMLGKKGKTGSLSQENEIIIQSLKKLNSPTSVFNPDSQMSLLDALTDSWAYPTGPSFVPYKWQAGVPKKSEAEELRRRFAYGMGGTPVSNNQVKTESLNEGEKTKGGDNRQNPSSTNEPRLLDALTESNEDLKGKDESFLRKWRQLKIKHLATQQALSKTGTPVTTPRQAKDKKTTHQFRQNLQTMRVNGKSRDKTVSNSPFSSLSLENKRNIFRDENQTLPSSISEQKYQSPVTTQRTMKKKLPTWLVTALRLKVNSEREKTTKSEQQKMYPNSQELDDVKNIYQGKSQDKQISNVDERGHHNSVVDKKIKQHKQSFINDVSNNDQKVLSKLDISSQQQPLNSYEQQDKQPSLAEVQSENQRLSKEMDTKLNKEDTESLVRYIITTLLARKNKVTDGIENEILSGFNRDKNTVNDARDQTAKWVSPNIKTGNFQKMLSESDRDSNIAVNAKKLPSFSKRVQSSEKVSPQSYNGLIFGSDYGYNQGIASSSPMNSQEERPRVWASNNAYDNSATMEEYRRTLNRLYGDQGHGKKNYSPELSQNVGYENPVHSRGVISTYQSTQPQLYSDWANSDSGSAEENFVHDPNHLWAMRAQKRQTLYHQQPKSEEPQLVCKALVAFGGGMDTWCTDNCNANFCPPSICVCKKQARASMPVLSSYTSVDNPVDKDADWEIHTPVKKNHHMSKSNPVSRRAQTMRNTPFYNPLFQNYPTSHQQTQDTDRHQRPSWTVFNPFHTNAFLTPVSTPDPFDSYSSSKSMPGKYLSPRIDEVNRSRQYAKMDAYMSKNVAKNDVDRLFDQNSILPPTKYNSKSAPRSANELPINSISWLQADKDYVDSDAASNLISLQDNLIVPGQGAFTGNQLEGAGVRGGVANSAVPGRPRMNCRAVGAYRGLDHFDEWCETTCYSSMCPLLMCECDQ